jgi:hypothetical protein
MMNDETFYAQRALDGFLACLGCLTGCALSLAACVVIGTTYTFTSLYTLPLLAFTLFAFGYYVQTTWLVLTRLQVAVHISANTIRITYVLRREEWSWQEIKDVEVLCTERGTQRAILLSIPKRQRQLHITRHVWGRSIDKMATLITSRCSLTTPSLTPKSER